MFTTFNDKHTNSSKFNNAVVKGCYNYATNKLKIFALHVSL